MSVSTYSLVAINDLTARFGKKTKAVHRRSQPRKTYKTTAVMVSLFAMASRAGGTSGKADSES